MDVEKIDEQLRDHVASQTVRVTAHAQAEMVDENITLDEVFEALGSCRVLENYPEHRRGACCLVSGRSAANRPLHVVCTTAQPVLILITVYEPKPPKWPTPEERRTQP